jgi:hypothetical protein
MKSLKIIAFVLITAFLIFQIYISMSTNNSETQSYKLIRSEDKFEIRHYPSAIMARVNSNFKTYKELGRNGFGKLANYIFGGNNEKKQIAMTSPVHMGINDSVSSMSFVMPSRFDMGNLPRPNNTDIILETSEPEFVAAIRFGGFPSTNKINEKIEELRGLLEEKGLKYHGHFRYLGYNPPYQLFGRRNEVIVSLEANQFKEN